MNIIKKFLLNDNKNIQKNSYLWNMMGGLLNAGQSVLILMVITRVAGIDDAGIFTIAYASANLFLTIGNYGMRSYQVTDVNHHFSFGDYLCSRLTTSLIMIIVSIAYVLYGVFFNGYSNNKALVVFVICLLKVIDAVEDVFSGYYQQQGRLDVGARIMTIRLLATIIVICGSMIVTRDLLISSIITTIICAFISILFNLCIYKEFVTNKMIFSSRKVIKLLVDCIGPFLAAFLAFYVGNAPKYAIDSYLSQDIQAYYGFIAMPVFVVGLLNNFLYQPILTSLASDWAERRRKQFVMRVCKQILIIFGITIITLIGAYLLGIPVLSVLYSADLSPYKMELLILLFGGGMLAVVGFINIVLTILRHQKDLIWGYMFIAIMAYILSPIFVKQWNITGASWIYAILISALALIFAAVLAFRIKKGFNE